MVKEGKMDLFGRKRKREMQRQKQKKSVTLSVIILLVLLAFTGIMAVREKGNTQTVESSETEQVEIANSENVTSVKEENSEEIVEDENLTEKSSGEVEIQYDLVCRWLPKSTTQTYYYFDFDAGVAAELSIITKKGSTEVKSVEEPKLGEITGDLQNGWTYGIYEFQCEERNGENRVIIYVNGNEHADCYIVDNALGLELLEKYTP
jgi:hypothetical protein